MKITTVISAILLVAGGAMAQTARGDIRGRETDEPGVALPGVTTDRPPTASEWTTANVWQDPTPVRIGVRLSF